MIRDVSTTLDIRGEKTKFSLLFPYLDRSGEVSREIVRVKNKVFSPLSLTSTAVERSHVLYYNCK